MPNEKEADQAQAKLKNMVAQAARYRQEVRRLRAVLHGIADSRPDKHMDIVREPELTKWICETCSTAKRDAYPGDDPHTNELPGLFAISVFSVPQKSQPKHTVVVYRAWSMQEAKGMCFEDFAKESPGEAVISMVAAEIAEDSLVNALYYRMLADNSLTDE